MDWSSFINKFFRLYTRLINFILTKDERLIQNMKVIIFKWGYVEKDIKVNQIFFLVFLKLDHT